MKEIWLTLVAPLRGDESILISGLVSVSIVEVESVVSPTGALEGNTGMEFECRGVCRLSVLEFGGLILLCVLVELEGIIFTVCIEVP